MNIKKEQKFELIGIIIFLLAIYVGFSLVTYNPAKNPLVTNVSKDYSVIGQIGMVIAFGLKVAFGWSSLLIPLMLIYIGIRLFDSSDRNFKSYYGVFLFMFAFSIIFGLFISKSVVGNVKPTQDILFKIGYLGWFSVRILIKTTGKLGAIIVAVLLTVGAIFTMTNFLFRKFVQKLKNKVFNLIALRRERKRKSLEKTVEKEKQKRIKRKEQKLSSQPVPQKKKAKVSEKKRAKAPPKKIEAIPIPVMSAGQIKPPPASILNPVSKGTLKNDVDALEALGEILIEKLNLLGVEATLASYVTGPTVTRYEITLSPGQRVSQITSLENDISYALAKSPVRIIAPIPGKQAIGIEIPNENKRTIALSEFMGGPLKKCKGLAFGIGCTIDGSHIAGCLNDMPHLLIAGSTGSGKSVMIKALIDFLLMQFTPDDLRMLLIDPKRVEMTKFRKLPHILGDIVVEPKTAAKKLQEMVRRMEFRYREMANYGLNHITKYNAYVEKHSKEDQELKKFPYIVVIIDELADLMMVARGDVESSIARLAQLARAVGIHLVLATQRPSVDVITGVIKSNFPVRISFRVASKVDSRTIFDKNGAEALLGKGDLLYLPPGSSDLVRAQAPFPADEETLRIVQYWASLDQQEFFDWEDEYVTEAALNGLDAGTKEVDDELFVPAVSALLEAGKVSTSYLQTVLSIGYNRSSRLIHLMEQNGIVSQKDKSGKREMLITEEKWYDMRKDFL